MPKRSITDQTIDAAAALGRLDCPECGANLEALCRFYASEVDRLQGSPTPNGDASVADEVAELRRDMAKVNARLAACNAENDKLRKKAS